MKPIVATCVNSVTSSLHRIRQILVAVKTVEYPSLVMEDLHRATYEERIR